MMEGEVKYPIYLVKKGSIDIERISDFIQLEAWVVKSDVRSNQYLAWDYYGRPLTLKWDHIRLDCSLVSDHPNSSLTQFLNEVAGEFGASFGDLNDEIDLELAYNRVKAEQTKAIKDYKAKNKILKPFTSIS